MWYDNGMALLVVIVFFAFVGIVGFVYMKNAKKREERKTGEPKKDPDMDSNAAKTQMGMYASGYEGISNRQRLN